MVVGEISKPRQGRYHLAHGVSHGIRTLSLVPRLPPGRERGEGVRTDVLTHGLRRGLNYVAHYVG